MWSKIARSIYFSCQWSRVVHGDRTWCVCETHMKEGKGERDINVTTQVTWYARVLKLYTHTHTPPLQLWLQFAMYFLLLLVSSELGCLINYDHLWVSLTLLQDPLCIWNNLIKAISKPINTHKLTVRTLQSKQWVHKPRVLNGLDGLLGPFHTL